MNISKKDYSKKKLLQVDDDDAFRNRLARAMKQRGYQVTTVATVAEAKRVADEIEPDFAVVDLRMPDGSGLDTVKSLRKAHTNMRTVILTGYGNIATAVAAVKVGAVDYLAKPANADEIHYALNAKDRPLPPPPENPMSADRVRWEHIQRVFEQCDRNVSETARKLNMHRRSLQRILSKYSPQ